MFLTPSTLVIAHDIALVVEIVSKLTNWTTSFPGSLFSASIVVETMEAEKRDPGNEVANRSHQKHPSLQLYSDTQADAVLAKLKEIRSNLSNSKILLYKLLVIWYGKIDEFQ